MIAHTKAYLRFREQGRELLDYAVLLAYALPALEERIAPMAGKAKGQIPEPYFFRNPNLGISDLKSRAQKASDTFARELIISSFSYFDAYFLDTLAEILTFHKDTEAIVAKGKRVLREADAKKLVDGGASWRKLVSYPRADWTARYDKHNRILKKTGYLFPSSRMSALGWMHLGTCLKNRRIRAADFIWVLQDALLHPISAADVKRFNDLRLKRNKIAHGRLSKCDPRESIEDGIWLRNLAVSIDKHVIENFFVIEM